MAQISHRSGLIFVIFGDGLWLYGLSAQRDAMHVKIAFARNNCKIGECIHNIGCQVNTLHAKYLEIYHDQTKLVS